MKKHGKLLLKYLLLFVMTVFVMGCFSVSAATKTGFVTQKGKTYYINKDGSKQKGWLELNGKKYELTKNDNGKNTLHGGIDFYNKRMWDVKEEDDTHVVFALVSPDGDQGFPGEVKIEVSYTITEENELKIHYHAIPDQDTLLNMTNHSYFNLSGHASGTAWNAKVWIDADAFTETDAELIASIT